MIIPALQCGGGLQKISLFLSEQLIDRGHNVVVVDSVGPPLERLTYLRVLPKFCVINSYHLSKRALESFSQIVAENTIDLIIYQGFFPEVNKFLHQWKKHNDIPIISVYHSSPEALVVNSINEIASVTLRDRVKRLAFPLYKIYQKYTLRNFFGMPADFSQNIVLLSESYKRIYQKLSGHSKNIEIITNFIPRKKAIVEHKKMKQLLYIGRLEESVKKVSRAIRIWESIAQQMPDWDFVIAGDGRCRNQYEEYVQKNNVPRVNFVGYISDPTDLYAESQILLFTSDFEGFSLVIVEAMQCGCVPIVYDSYASAKDIIDSGVNGILIPPFDEEIFKKELLTLMNDGQKCKAMSINAITTGMKYLPENIVPKWENLIDSIIQNKK